MVVGILVLAFLGVYTWYGWLLTIQSQGNTSPMLVLPKPLWYAAVPVSGLVMIGYTVARLWPVIGAANGKRGTGEAR
jgi:TRAP-type C4-dicarboxylate transport system permease small subunit